VRGGEIIHYASGFGVKPLLAILETTPEILKGSQVYDKIIGKAAASLLALGGAVKAYGEIMSESAERYLAGRGIDYAYTSLVSEIKNRTGDDMCPLEKSVLDEDDPAECHKRLAKTVAALMGKA